MATPKSKPGITGIEPGTLSLPTMDRPSLAFAWFLDRMVVATESRSPSDPGLMTLQCEYCGDDICEIEPADTLRVLLNTALAHTCGGA